MVHIILKTNGKCKMHIMYMCSKNYYDRLFLSLLLFIFTYLLYTCTIAWTIDMEYKDPSLN